MMRFRIRLEKWCKIKHFLQHVTCNNYHDGMNKINWKNEVKISEKSTNNQAQI